MKLLPRIQFEPGERPRDEITAMRPTVEEDACWQVERGRHARIVFWKSSLLPGLVLVAGGVLSHPQWSDRRIWLTALAAGTVIAGGGWLAQWKLVEGPKRRLAALRESRLLRALHEEDLEERERPRKLEV